MQLSDDPEDWCWFRWEWAKPGAKVMPFPHAFGHPIWHKGEGLPAPGAQILLEGGVWRGNRTSRHDGQHIVGARQLWEEGLPAGDRGPEDGAGCGGFGWLVRWGVGVTFHVPEDVVVPAGGVAIGGAATWSLPIAAPEGGVAIGGAATWSLPIAAPEGGVAIGGAGAWSLPIMTTAGGIGVGGEAHSCLLATQANLPPEVWVRFDLVSGGCVAHDGDEFPLVPVPIPPGYYRPDWPGEPSMNAYIGVNPGLWGCSYKMGFLCEIGPGEASVFWEPTSYDPLTWEGDVTFEVSNGGCCDGVLHVTISESPSMPYQPLSSILTQIAAETSDGYLFCDGAGDWFTVDTVPWSDVASTPSTLGGYGITDAQPQDDALDALTVLGSPGYVFWLGGDEFATLSSILWSEIILTPDTLAGYGITDAVQIDSVVGEELGNAIKLTNETTTSTTFVALTTAQSVTFDAPASGSVSVELFFQGHHSVAGGLIQGGLTLDGATTLLVGGTRCETVNANYPVAARWHFTGLSAGSHTIAAEYRIATAGTGTFFDRFLVLKRL